MNPPPCTGLGLAPEEPERLQLLVFHPGEGRWSEDDIKTARSATLSRIARLLPAVSLHTVGMVQRGGLREEADVGCGALRQLCPGVCQSSVHFTWL